MIIKQMHLKDGETRNIFGFFFNDCGIIKLQLASQKFSLLNLVRWN